MVQTIKEQLNVRKIKKQSILRKFFLNYGIKLKKYGSGNSETLSKFQRSLKTDDFKKILAESFPTFWK